MNATHDGPQIQTLGNVIGGRRYFGACFACGSQFMSTHDRVVVLGGVKYCVSCGCAEHAQAKGAKS